MKGLVMDENIIKKYPPIIDGLTARYDYKTLDNFNFSLVNERVKEIVLNYKHNESLLFMGTTGVGKTHLAVATVKAIKPRKRVNYFHGQEPKEYFYNTKAVFVNSSNYFGELIKEINSGYQHNYFRKIINYDLLIFDDLGTEKMTDFKREQLYILVNYFYENNKPLIITTNLTTSQLNKYDPRIFSRLNEMGRIIRINAKDYRLESKLKQNQG